MQHQASQGEYMSKFRLTIVAFAALIVVAMSSPVGAQQVSPQLFGMHMTGGVTGAEPWPVDSISGVRLWDSNTPWSQLNPSQGTYNWSILNIWLNHAQDHGVDVLYTFGRTPQWASSNPNDSTCGNEPGSCDPPNDLNADGTGTDQHWKDFVTAIATFSAGRIHYWEIWDEAPNPFRWNGTDAQLIRMASDARAIIHSIDSTAVITTPSGSLRYANDMTWWSNYLAAGGGNFADVIAYHGYIQPGKGLPVPEKLVSLLTQFNQILKTYGQSAKPVWDTEASWGGTILTGLTDFDMQAGFTARFYLIHQSIGTQRLYWYEWENWFDGTLWTFNSQVDLAVATQGGSNMTTLLGYGDGTFTAPVNYGTANSPASVAVGDFNRDGKLDVVVANQGSNTVSILLGNGNGTFQSPVTYNAGAGPIAVAVGDLNGDGKLDLAVANFGGNNVSILLGNGDGTFQPAVNYAAAGAPRSVTLGDFNNDGKLDLAVANSGSNNVSVLLGNGNGTFQTAVNTPVDSTPYSVVAAKFNGDAYLDLAVANWGSNNVGILLGKGNGTFKPAVNYPAGTNPSALAVGYFNGAAPKVADLAVTNAGSNNVSILMGAGNGTFAAAVNYAVGTQPSAIAVRDFNAQLNNGSGKPDLVVANQGSNNVSVLLGLGKGLFQAAINSNAGSSPVALAVGNFSVVGAVDPGTLLKPGVAYQTVYNWMVGATMAKSACTAVKTIWTCKLTRTGGYQALAVWDSSQKCSLGVCTTSTYNVGPPYIQYQNVYGQTTPITGSTVQIGYQPILLQNQNP